MLSEIDTQILLIEPILQIADWDILDPSIVKRASRSNSKQEFDIEIYESINNPPRVKIAIECKSLDSPEFNADKIPNGIGKLVQKYKKKKNAYYWANKSRDGIGQIRAYCANYAHYNPDYTIPVMTNGCEWLIFKSSQFANDSRLSSPVTNDDIFRRAKLTDDDFQDKIVNSLKSSNT